MTACMGGWCVRRDQCQHYHQDNRAEPAERLCEPKQYGAFMAINLHKVEQPQPATEPAHN